MSSLNPLAQEFVLFCVKRRGSQWPALYDEMCRVAGGRLFRNMGYGELNKLGLSFGLNDIEDTIKIVDGVIGRVCCDTG